MPALAVVGRRVRKALKSVKSGVVGICEMRYLEKTRMTVLILSGEYWTRRPGVAHSMAGTAPVIRMLVELGGGGAGAEMS